MNPEQLVKFVKGRKKLRDGLVKWAEAKHPDMGKALEVCFEHWPKLLSLADVYVEVRQAQGQKLVSEEVEDFQRHIDELRSYEVLQAVPPLDPIGYPCVVAHEVLFDMADPR